MNLLALLPTLLALALSGVLPDSTRFPTLTEDYYLMAKQSGETFPADCQFIFSDGTLIGGGISNEGKYIRVFGDGTVLSCMRRNDGLTDNYSFYYAHDCDLLENIADTLVENGLFQSKSGEISAIMSPSPGIDIHITHLSLRISDKYYTIEFIGFGDEKPEWEPLKEYVDSVMSSYMIEDNLISGEDCLKILDGQIEVYGKDGDYDGKFIAAYIERIKAGE